MTDTDAPLHLRDSPRGHRITIVYEHGFGPVLSVYCGSDRLAWCLIPHAQLIWLAKQALDVASPECQTGDGNNGQPITDSPRVDNEAGWVNTRHLQHSIDVAT